jgi:mRNA-degrading endonuclease toxin of MazEF toxin-antitoxin module
MLMPKYEKGDVVLVSMPRQIVGGFETRRRPAVIISGQALAEALIVPITSNFNSPHQGRSISVSMESPEARAAGLRRDCLIDCTVVATVPTALIVNRIGHLSEDTMARIDECIRYDSDDNS